MESKTAYSTKDIKKLSGLSTGGVHKVITLLLKERIIMQKKGKGKQRFYQVNLENKYASKVLGIFEDERNERRGIPLHVWNTLESLCSDLKAKIKGINDIILFGSFARGEFRIYSDIDLLIVTEDSFKEESKARMICKHIKLKNKVNPTFITEKEIMQHKTKASDFYESILKDGLRLV